MKKIYVFLLLTIYTFTSFCMDNELKNVLTLFSQKKYDTFVEVPLDDFVTDKSNILQKQTTLVLGPCNACIVKQNLIEKLYSEVSNLAEHIFINSNQMMLEGSLSLIINNLNNARNDDINEDLLAQFAYNKHSQLFLGDTTNTTLLFGCLKRYHLTTKNTQEKVPFKLFTQKDLITIHNNNLTQALTIQKSTKKKPHAINLSYLIQFPAYIALIDSLNILCAYPDTIKKIFASCLYFNKPTVFPPYPSPLGDLVNIFYNKTYNLLFSHENLISTDTICNLIFIIETAKIRNYIKNEKDFGYTLLNLKPTTDFIDFGINCYNFNYDQRTTRNRISLFYKLLTIYNQQRNNKKIPHTQQYYCYKLITITNLALPDNFSSDLFNPNIYAFEELSELINGTEALSKVDDTYVEDCVKSYYPHRIGLTLKK